MDDRARKPAVPPMARLTVAGDRTIDQRWIEFSQRIVISFSLRITPGRKFSTRISASPPAV